MAPAPRTATPVTNVLKVLVAIVFTALVPPVHAQSSAKRAAPPAGWTEFVREFDRAAEADSIVGASILFVRDGRVIAHHEHGDADRARHVAVNERTIFHYGSITKTLTAIAIMQLRDRGKLTLDDPVTRWVPELRLVHDPYGSIDSVTIRMLLTHTAGFQAPTWNYGAGNAWEPFEPTTWDQLVAMMPYQELAFKPGTRFSYSNPGFVYLARIIEAISGDPWETYVQKNILSPLGLARSYFGVTPYYLAGDRSHNYAVVRDSAGHEWVRDNGAEFDPGITIPNSGWNAPLTDLAVYLAFLTNAPHDDSTRRRMYDVVLARASLEEMWRARYQRSVDSLQRSDSIGLSFFVVHRERGTFIGHTGSQAGFLALLYFNPATGAGFVASFNTADEGMARTRPSAYATIRDAALRLIE